MATGSNYLIPSLIAFTLFASAIYVIMIENAIESHLSTPNSDTSNTSIHSIADSTNIPTSNQVNNKEQIPFYHPDHNKRHKPNDLRQRAQHIKNLNNRKKSPPKQNKQSPAPKPHPKRPPVKPGKVTKIRTSARQATSGNVCRSIISKKPVWSMNHHKTGHDLSWAMGGVFHRYCGKSMIFKSEFSIRGFVNSCRPKDTPNKCLYIHWVRHPLNTIISGFYYHLKTDEEWVHDWNIGDSVNTAIDMDMNALYHDILANTTETNGYYEAYRKERIVIGRGRGKQRQLYKRKQMTKLLTCFDVSNNSVLYEYVHEFMVDNILSMDDSEYYMIDSDINRKITLLKFYNNLKERDYKIGLFWEFVRYFTCEWPSIYVLQEIGERYFVGDNNKVIRTDVDDMMRREGGFDDAMNEILDAMGLTEDEGMKRAPQMNNLNATIKEQREKFMKRLITLDLSRNKVSGAKSQKSKEHLDMHITHNSYDLEQVSHDLLTLDVNICMLIKNMTELLMFEWNYSQYC